MLKRAKLATKIFLLSLVASILILTFLALYALLEKDNVECIFSDVDSAEFSAREIFRVNSMGIRVDRQQNKLRDPNITSATEDFEFRVISVVRLGDGDRYSANVRVIHAETGKEAGTMRFQTGCEWVDYQPAP